MKALLSALAICAILVLFAALTLVELLIRLAPLVIVVAIGWTLVADDARLVQMWAQHPAQAVPSPPAPPTRPAPVHRERTYLIAGRDIGFATPCEDPYLNVGTPAPPTAHRPPPRRPRRAHRRARRGNTRP